MNRAKTKQWLSLFLAIAMLLSFAPLSALAATKEMTATFVYNIEGKEDLKFSVSDKTIDETGTITWPKNPQKNGYTFDGWYTNLEKANTKSTAKANKPFTLTKNTMVFYAKWVPIEYTVTYNPSNGADSFTQKVPFGSVAAQPADPVRDGFTFLAWYAVGADEKLAKTAFNFSETPIESDLTLQAKWSKDAVKVTFVYDTVNLPADDLNGGSVIAKVNNGDTVNAAPEGIYDFPGYAITGWHLEKDITSDPKTQCGDVNCEKPMFDLANTPITKNITLYAHYEKTDVNVTFVLNDAPTTTTTATKNKAGIAIPAAVQAVIDAYAADWVVTWHTTADFSDAAIDLATFTTATDTTLYGKWTQQNFTVTFDLLYNGVTGVAKVAEGQSPGTEPKAVLDEFAKWPAYTLAWYDNQALTGDPVDLSNYPITANTTLFAKWNPIKVTVSFDTVGGTPVAAQTVNYGAPATFTANPTKAGFTFAGWFLPDGTPFYFLAEQVFKADTVITAKWSGAAPVTVTFVSTVLLPEKVSVPVNGTVAPPDANKYKKAGEVLTGWTLDGVAFDFATPITAPITLNAVWEKGCTVTFANGVSGAKNQAVTVLPGQTVKEADVTVPMNAGKVLEGWYWEKTLLNRFDFSTPITGDLKLYAKWIDATEPVDPTDPTEPTDPTDPTDPVVKWTVTFAYTINGNEESEVREVEDGLPMDEPAINVDGYTIDGWYEDTAFTKEFDFDTSITQNMKLWAKLSPITAVPCTVTFDTVGGTAIEAQEVPRGDYAVQPTDPTKTGYTFGGWYADAACTEGKEFDFENTEIESNLTVYTKWILDAPTQEDWGITSFTFDDALKSKVNGLKIKIVMPYGTDLSELKDPTIVYENCKAKTIKQMGEVNGEPTKVVVWSNKKSVAELDFSKTAYYTVVNKDGQTKTYTVTITQAAE